MLLEPESARVWIIGDIRQNEEAAEADTNSHDAVDDKKPSPASNASLSIQSVHDGNCQRA